MIAIAIAFSERAFSALLLALPVYIAREDCVIPVDAFVAPCISGNFVLIPLRDLELELQISWLEMI
jgi:hypothetical protein